MEDAAARMRLWCDRQERSEHEVREKLFSISVTEDDAETVLARLRSEGYVDNQRFAEAYVSGKFRIKHWGRHKIRQGLKYKGLDTELISWALSSVTDQEYLDSMEELAEKKMRTLGPIKDFQTEIKLQRFLISRGFEVELVQALCMRLKDY